MIPPLDSPYNRHVHAPLPSSPLKLAGLLKSIRCLAHGDSAADALSDSFSFVLSYENNPCKESLKKPLK